MNNRVLLVDDDLDILSGFQRNLRKHFTIKTASGGIEALETIRDNPPFAVIVSDYNMPKMHGIELLSNVRKVSPDTVRIMLTGFADLETSINAVNEGSVFRFLTKPVNTETLLLTINDAIEQHRLITSEKELLEKTLKGTIKILIDVLTIVNPIAFQLATQIRNTARLIANQMSMKNVWEVEIAALLSQIGCVTVPESVLNKVYKDDALSEEEYKLYFNFPSISEHFVKNIPRFEKISVALKYQFYNFDGSNSPEPIVKGDELPLIARILKVAIDFNHFIQKGYSQTQSVTLMKSNSFIYDPVVFTVLMTVMGSKSGKGFVIKSLSFRQLRIGMVLDEDIKDTDQFILIAKGQEVTDIMLLRLINIARIKTVQEPIRVIEYIN
jgi:response regulator RpfG family c-di-GMP phosphodiesterase